MERVHGALALAALFAGAPAYCGGVSFPETEAVDAATADSVEARDEWQHCEREGTAACFNSMQLLQTDLNLQSRQPPTASRPGPFLWPVAAGSWNRWFLQQVSVSSIKVANSERGTSIVIGICFLPFVVVAIALLVCKFGDWDKGRSQDDEVSEQQMPQWQQKGFYPQGASARDHSPSMPGVRAHSPSMPGFRAQSPGMPAVPRSQNMVATSHTSSDIAPEDVAKTASTGTITGVPPPICPELILPNTGARLVITMDNLMNPSDVIHIQGKSGVRLLSLTFARTQDGRRCLHTFSSGCSQVRCTITEAAEHDREGTMEILGKDATPYGTITPGSDNVSHIKVNDQRVMSIEVNEADEEIRVTCVTAEGRMLATGIPDFDTAPVEQETKTPRATQWKLFVFPGVDAVLISSSALAVLLFHHRAQRRG